MPPFWGQCELGAAAATRTGQSAATLELDATKYGAPLRAAAEHDQRLGLLAALLRVRGGGGLGWVGVGGRGRERGLQRVASA